MTGKEKLAERIKELKVKPSIGITTGKVTSASPLEISITDDIVAKSPHLIKATGLSLLLDDKVIIISTDNDKFYVLAKSEVV